MLKVYVHAVFKNKMRKLLFSVLFPSLFQEASLLSRWSVFKTSPAFLNPTAGLRYKKPYPTKIPLLYIFILIIFICESSVYGK